jgi:hypothetical protein
MVKEKLRIKTMKRSTANIIATMALLLLADFGLMAIEHGADENIFKENFLSKQFRISGGLNAFSVNGKAGDYEAGANDFPVTPAYQTPAFGLGFAYFTSRSFAVGLDVGYGFSTSVGMRDPADGESIRVDTPKSIVVALDVFQYLDLSRRMRWFVCLGGGAEYRMAEDKEYVSALGSRIIISAPARPLSPLADAGMGLQYMFSVALGINLECRATYIFRDPAQMLVSSVLALVLKF